MHEYSIVSALVHQVEVEARAHRALAVQRVRVRLGELAGVESELLVAAYELARAGTVCAGAELEIVAVPARWECSECSATIPRGARLTCPRCARPARLAAGEDLLLERIEMEVPDV
jgi:hydrogenase nickel incorporation protein HypA/HybF